MTNGLIQHIIVEEFTSTMGQHKWIHFQKLQFCHFHPHPPLPQRPPPTPPHFINRSLLRTEFSLVGTDSFFFKWTQGISVPAIRILVRLYKCTGKAIAPALVSALAAAALAAVALANCYILALMLTAPNKTCSR